MHSKDGGYLTTMRYYVIVPLDPVVSTFWPTAGFFYSSYSWVSRLALIYADLSPIPPFFILNLIFDGHADLR